NRPERPYVGWNSAHWLGSCLSGGIGVGPSQDIRSRRGLGALACPRGHGFDARPFTVGRIERRWPLLTKKRPLDPLDPSPGTGAVLASARLARLDDLCGDVAEDNLTTVLRDRIDDPEGARL